MLKQLEKVLIKTIDIAVAIFFAVVVVLVFMQVYTRFLTDASITWAEEAGRFLMIWMVMLSAVSLYCRHGHVWVELLVDYLPKSIRKTILILGHILTIAFFAIIISGSFRLLPITWKQASPSLRIPMAIPYSSIPLSCLLMIFFTVRDIVVELSHKEKRVEE